MHRLMLLIPLAAACGHSEPFTAPDTGLDQPRVPGNPARLTYATGTEMAPAWTPDGASIVYSFELTDRPGSPEADRCLGVMPVGGGTVEREICNPSAFEADSTETYDWPALNAAGDLAYVRSTRPSSVNDNRFGSLLVAPYANPAASRELRSFPFQGVSAFYPALSSLRWLSDDELVFIAVAEEIVNPCGPVFPCEQLVRYGREIHRLVASDPGPSTAVAGTSLATSVAPGESADVIYFTLANDSRVYRQTLSTGTSAAVHDFGGPIARDVHYAAGRLAVIVGGQVTVHDDDIGPVQVLDRGGLLMVVDLATGTAIEAAVPQVWFRRPAFSPDGTRLAAQGHSLIISPLPNPPPAADTTYGDGNIWLFGAP